MCVPMRGVGILELVKRDSWVFFNLENIFCFIHYDYGINLWLNLCVSLLLNIIDGWFVAILFLFDSMEIPQQSSPLDYLSEV